MRVRETEGFVVESDDANLGTVDGFQAGGGSGAEVSCWCEPDCLDGAE